MGGISFGWLAVCVLSPDWLSHKLEVCDFCQVLRWSRRTWGRGVRAVPRLCIVHPGICLTTEEKSQKTLSQGIQRALGWSASNAVRLVDLAIVCYGLNWPAGPCRPWLLHQVTGSALSQYLPNCHTRRFPTSANFWVKALSQGSDVVGKQRNTQILVSACYLHTRGHQ